MMYFFTASDLHPVDMGWASSMSITLRELEPKQKLLSLMNWLKWCIFLPPLTSNQWTWGGPPPWLSPWQAWNQNKSCLAWWTDHFDVFFWPPLTTIWWTWGGPPPWLSPWRAWNQNKSCLAWWTDHFDVFFDRLQPPTCGHGVSLLHGYHPDGLGTKTKVA